ncbi:GNAT family N-acetyltransferase [Phytohabitans aurantiacus]|uniref:N-acetyltransferase n=1 Tax=Phytohabitans aurantiacus TaxID=3016789 RepID=A0ABQ5QRU5_9ACTN|nr:GNAT family N-acetyltransferase [Phytohabitans aurantiacus]GLH96964.1 N-acetyltransferase [Phytohabitans aurantiacus]
MNVLVADNPARRRFEILVDGGLAGFAAYRVRDGLIVFTHTEIDDAFQGKGVGAQLAAGALDQVRERGEKVVPQCPFIAAFVKRHTEYADLVVEE